MKKFLSVCIISMLSVALSMAAESLGFKVMGIEITDADANDIVSAVKKANNYASISGEMWFENYEKVYGNFMPRTLFIKGTYAAAEDAPIIENFEGTLRIVFVGYNKWDVLSDQSGIYNSSSGKTYLSGDTLRIFSKAENTIALRSDAQYSSMEIFFMKDLFALTDIGFLGNEWASLSIYSSQVSLLSTQYAISTARNITFQDSKVTLQGVQNTVNNITYTPYLTNCVCEKGNITLDSTNKTWLFDGQTVKGENVYFTPQKPDTGTGVYIFGTMLEEGTDKTLNFTEGTYTLSGDELTLKNFKRTDAFDTNAGLTSLKNNLTIILEGDNEIISSYSPALYTTGDIRFKGDGTLNLVSSTFVGVQIMSPEESKSIEVYSGGLQISISGQTYGVEAITKDFASINMSARLLTDDAKLDIYGKLQPVIGKSLYLYNVGEIHGALWNDKTRKGEYQIDGRKVTDATLTFEKTSFFVGYFCDQDITNFSANHLSKVAGMKAGTVVYDHATKTLTLNNAEIEYGSQPIYIKEDMTVVCKGDNKITTTDASSSANNAAISFHSKEGDKLLTLTGKLEINTTEAGIALHESEEKLVIQDAELTIKSRAAAIRSAMSSPLSLEINRSKATLSPTGTGFEAGTFTYSAISNFAELTMNECEFKYPTNITFNATTRELEVNGTKFTNEVIIEGNPILPQPETSGLQTISANDIKVIDRNILIENEIGQVNLFDMLGKRIATAQTPVNINVNNAGIYILQTKEGTVKLLVR